MHCPFCNANETKVNDSRLVSDGTQVKRRRECLACQERFTTFEVVELALPRVIKRDGSRNPFDEDKLRQGIMRSLEKRPVDTEDIETSISNILRKVRGTGEREVPAAIIGDWVMDELRHLDQVAYVRFASVYRSFQDVNEFREAVNKLEEHE